MKYIFHIMLYILILFFFIACHKQVTPEFLEAHTFGSTIDFSKFCAKYDIKFLETTDGRWITTDETPQDIIDILFNKYQELKYEEILAQLELDIACNNVNGFDFSINQLKLILEVINVDDNTRNSMANEIIQLYKRTHDTFKQYYVKKVKGYIKSGEPHMIFSLPINEIYTKDELQSIVENLRFPIRSYEQCEESINLLRDTQNSMKEAGFLDHAIYLEDHQLRAIVAARDRFYNELICPLEIVSLRLKMDWSFVELFPRFRNISDRTIDAFQIEIECYDRFGEPADGIYNNICKAQGQITIKPKRTSRSSFYVSLASYSHTSEARVKVVKVHFKDGGTWLPTIFPGEVHVTFLEG